MRESRKSGLPGEHDALIQTLAAMLASGSAQNLPTFQIEAAVSLLQDETPRAALSRVWALIHPDGAMIDCSANAAALFGLSSPGDKIHGVAERLAQARGDTELLALNDLSGRSLILQATRTPDRRSWQLQDVSSPIAPEFRAAIIALWSLTPTEAVIAETLLLGKAPDQIAADTGRAVGTVRQIIKALLAKMQVHSQAQAVARMAVVALAYGKLSQPSSDLPQRYRRPYADATDSPLIYWRYGETGGRPVLFFHGALFGIIGRAGVAAEARLFGLDVIAPERPGYGDTSLPPGADPIALSIDRARAILDLEKIAQVQIMAHDVGSVYAFAFARANPERVSGIICAPATPPMMGWSQTADMPPLHRVSAFAAQNAPAVMEVLVKLGLKRIEREGLVAIPRLIFADSDHDRTAMLRPEAYPILENLYLSAVEQRASGFLQDMLVTNLNWSSWLPQITCPVALLHGRESRTVSEQALRTTCAALRHATLTIIPDAGHTLPITHPTHALRQVLASPVRL
jgi:pimeloyl-ACP methyl ester carboxylesterase/DNA-binding CsgD family transcriptional regulator